MKITRLPCLISPLLVVIALDAAPPPNFIIILADDLTYHDIGPSGNTEVDTPHLDRLASEGMTLTRIFTPAPSCSPTRHALYNGLFPIRSGAHPNHAIARPDTRSMPHFLKDLGYRVALAGKTHIGPEEAYPFEYILRPGNKRIGGNDPDLPFWNRVNDFIARDADEPFCFVFASDEPHGPLNKGDPSAYDRTKLKLPPYLVDTPHTREIQARYYAEIAYLDGEVGRMLEALAASGRAANTVVLFLTEHGAGVPFAKWTLYDAGIRATGIVRWPGKAKPGSESSALIQYVDILPTFLEAAGGKPDSKFDGHSIHKILTGEKTHHRDHVYAVQTTRGIIQGAPAYGIRSIRDDRYKYILNLHPENEFANVLTAPESALLKSWRKKAETDGFARQQIERYIKRPEVEFYDLENDPFEMKNIAGRPEHEARMQHLRGKLDGWMKEQGDSGRTTEMAALDHMDPDARTRAERALKKREKPKPPSNFHP